MPPPSYGDPLARELLLKLVDTTNDTNRQMGEVVQIVKQSTERIDALETRVAALSQDVQTRLSVKSLQSTGRLALWAASLSSLIIAIVSNLPKILGHGAP